MGGHPSLVECRSVSGRLQPFLQIYHDTKEHEPVERGGDHSRPKKSKKLDNPVSSFMFLVNVREAFGYTHEQTLNSSYALIMGMLQEYTYMCNERNRILYGDEDEDEGYEWVELVDFTTGEPRRYRKYMDAKSRI